MSRSPAIIVLMLCAFFQTGRAFSVVFYATDDVNYHRSAPTGTWSGSGWEQTVPLDIFLGTVFFSNAILTASHLHEYLTNGMSFSYSDQTHTVTATTNDPASDLRVMRFTPPTTNWAYLNIEPSVDTGRWTVVQGRGCERDSIVTTGNITNGWRRGSYKWRRRWGINRFDGFANYDASSNDNVLAWAAFDVPGHSDECMLSRGDSGGPSFVATGSGWKLIGINYAVDPESFSNSISGGASFDATLYDYSGLYYKDGTNWLYAAPTNDPLPCKFFVSRVSQRIAWLTNVVQGLTFPADVGLAWTGGTPGENSGDGITFTLLVTNCGPYTVHDLGIDVSWSTALRVRNITPSAGTYASATGRWTLPELADGNSATLHLEGIIWCAIAVSGTNYATIIVADKPDEIPSNNTACVVFTRQPTATLLHLR